MAEDAVPFLMGAIIAAFQAVMELVVRWRLVHFLALWNQRHGIKDPEEQLPDHLHPDSLAKTFGWAADSLATLGGLVTPALGYLLLLDSDSDAAAIAYLLAICGSVGVLIVRLKNYRVRRFLGLTILTISTIGLNLALAVVVVLRDGEGSGRGSNLVPPNAPMIIGISSPAMTREGTFLPRYTCDGKDVSPPLRVAGIPPNVAQLALLMEDLDVRPTKNVHWSVWGIIPEPFTVADGEAPPGSFQGRNDMGRQAYTGPCPSQGETHRYIITLVALRQRLTLRQDAEPQDLRDAVEGKVVAWGRISMRTDKLDAAHIARAHG